jgi:hypothetical protein
MAQVEISGRIVGTVTDASGAFIPGASVTVTGPTLFEPRMAVTSEAGTYFIDKLPLGDYKIAFALPGFKTIERSGVTITANFSATINAALAVGAASETVDVLDAAPVVDVRTATQATVFDDALLNQVPTGRDTWSTLETVPGLVSTKFDVGGTQSFQQTGVSAHGSNGQTAYNVNGLNLNWPGGSGNATAFYFDNDGFQEVQAVTDAPQAETMVGGVQINMISKQGTNQFHGQALGTYTTAALATAPTYPTFNGVPVPSGENITMMRDTNVQAGFPIIKNRLWWFSGYRRYDINLADPGITRLDGSAIKDNNHQSNLDARLDISLTNRNKLSLNWLYNSINRFYRGATGLTDEDATRRQIEPAWIGQAQWTYTPTSSLVFESRFGNMTLHFGQGYQPTVKPGTISVTDSVLGTVKYAPPGGNAINYTWHARATENVSYVRPKWLGANHNFRAGFEYAQENNGNSTYVYGDLTVTVANGLPQYASLLNTPFRSLDRINETAGFIQDSISLGRLTINAGVRYDRFLTFLPPQQSPAGTWVGARSYPRSGNLVFNDLSPRVSVAFDPSGAGKSVFRASYSRFVNLQGASLIDQFNPNASSSVRVTFASLGSNNYPIGLSTSPIFVDGGQFRTADPNLRRGFSRQITAGYERQVLNDVRVSVGYYYRDQGNYQTSFNRALTVADYSPLTVVNGLTNQPITIYNLAAAKVGINPNTVISNAATDPHNAYNAVEINASKRMSKNWQLLTGFTIQKNNSDTVYDPTNPNADLYIVGNRATTDSTFVGKVAGTYRAPLGITVSGNFQHYTGYPVQATEVFSNGVNASGQTVKLNQGTVTVPLENVGGDRLPSVNLLNLRFAHVKSWETFKVSPSMDLDNIFNVNTVTGITSTIGPNFKKPLTTISQRFVRFGLRIEF